MPMARGKNSAIAYYKQLQKHKGFWILTVDNFKRNQQLTTFLMTMYVYVYIDIYVCVCIYIYMWISFKEP